jgi:RHS repeat-associated protein
MGDRTSLAATIAGTPDFINNYSYDGDQNLIVVQQQQQTGGNTVANKEIDYGYNAIGQFTAIGYYDELSGPRTDIATGAFSYDTDGRLTGLAYTSDGGQNTIDTYGWAYNAGSLVTSFTSNDGTASYGYDPTNQLTSATYTTNSGGHQPANESYSFTANGNRNMTGYSTGSDNLTSSDGTYNYGYDADGNLVSRTQIANTYSTDYKTTYSWDYRNRLTDVENYDNNGVLTQHVHYVYDVFDHLIATDVDTTGDGTYNVIDHYVLDVSPEIPAAGVPGTATAQPALVFDGNGNLIGRNLVALDPAGVDAVMIEGTVTSTSQADVDQFNLFDNLGSLRIIVNDASATLDRIVYNSSGEVAYESSPTTAHFTGFAGGHVDPYTGLVNDYHRWYDPATGKWITPDPEGFAAADANLSRYITNDPTGNIDPPGLAPGVHHLPPIGPLPGQPFDPNVHMPTHINFPGDHYPYGSLLRMSNQQVIILYPPNADGTIRIIVWGPSGNLIASTELSYVNPNMMHYGGGRGVFSRPAGIVPIAPHGFGLLPRFRPTPGANSGDHPTVQGPRGGWETQITITETSGGGPPLRPDPGQILGPLIDVVPR